MLLEGARLTRGLLLGLYLNIHFGFHLTVELGLHLVIHIRFCLKDSLQEHLRFPSQGSSWASSSIPISGFILRIFL